MEPRWIPDWINDPDKQFVGGINECDLWLYRHSELSNHKGEIASIRIVRGDGINSWTYVWWTSGGIMSVCPSDVVTGFSAFIDTHKADIDTYLRLFVPELAES